MELAEKRELLQLAVQAAIAAGEVILGRYRSSLPDWKSPNNPVTKADLEADALIRNQLLDATPHFGWLSEETNDDLERLNKSICWVVDPLDGTQEFVDGVDQFAVSIGLVQKERPVLGVVFNPATGELFSAIVGSGANHEKMLPGPLSDRDQAAGATILASDTEIDAGMWDAFPELILQPVGSAALKLARLAAGFGDAYISFKPKNEWDICAGAALVKAAGGRVTNLKGLPVGFNRPQVKVEGVLAANPALHSSLLRLLVIKMAESG